MPFEKQLRSQERPCDPINRVIYPGKTGVGVLGSSAERISVYAAQLPV
jgi:hypothetical protein